MRLLDKYIGREVLSHAALGFVVFTFVFFIPQLVRLMEMIVRHSASWGALALLFLSALPPFLVFTIPMAVLVGVLIGLGRLSADGEIVAVHASGVSLRRVLAPIAAVGLLCAALSLALTLWLSPAAVRTSNRVLAKVLSSEAPFSVRARVFDERFPGAVLYVQDTRAGGARWRGVFFATSDGAEGPAILIAQSATVAAAPHGGQIELHLHDGSSHEYNRAHANRYDLATFGEMDIPVPGSTGAAAPQSQTLMEAAKPVGALLADRGPDWRDARVEMNNRFAFPAACLIFALLGVPLGVRPRRGGRAAGLILTLVLVGGYYFVWVAGDHLAREGRLPPWAGVWSANIVAVIAAILFQRRIETIRKPSRLFAWFESLRGRLRTRKQAAARAAAMPNGVPWLRASGIRQMAGAGRAVGFPLLMDFYLLSRFLYFFFVLLAGFVIIFDAFTLFDLLGDISKNSVSPWAVANYFRYLVPYMVYHLAPLATLVATLITLAILAKNNELVAFKASGVSLYRLVLPLLLAGCLVAGGLFALDNTYLPYANQRQEEYRSEIKGKPARTYFQPAQQWILGRDHRLDKIYNYRFFDVGRQVFDGLSIFELDPDTFELRRRVYAERATWAPDQNLWVLYGGWERDFSPDGQLAKYQKFAIYSLPEINEPPGYFTREVLQSEQMSWRQLRDYIGSLRQAGFDFDTSRLSIELERKFAFPLLAAIIVLLAAPFALLTGTRGAIGGLAVAVGIGIAYWAAAALFEALGAVGQLPAVLAGWAPDAIFGLLGLYFLLKIPT